MAVCGTFENMIVHILNAWLSMLSIWKMFHCIWSPIMSLMSTNFLYKQNLFVLLSFFFPFSEMSHFWHLLVLYCLKKLKTVTKTIPICTSFYVLMGVFERCSPCRHAWRVCFEVCEEHRQNCSLSFDVVTQFTEVVYHSQFGKHSIAGQVPQQTVF